MQIRQLQDQWICSCGNWVSAAFTWCPSCCEDRHREAEFTNKKPDHGGAFFVSADMLNKT